MVPSHIIDIRLRGKGRLIHKIDHRIMARFKVLQCIPFPGFLDFSDNIFHFLLLTFMPGSMRCKYIPMHFGKKRSIQG